MGQIHDGHRMRMRERFSQNGFEGFADHEVLEMLLYGALPRVNTNPIAHRLIDRFGSFANVCNASIEELMKVEGVGRVGALHIKMLPEYFRFYMQSMDNQPEFMDLSKTENVVKRLRPFFLGKQNELFYLLTLTSDLKEIECTLMGEGLPNTVEIEKRKLMEVIFRTNSPYIIIAHNHPKGQPLPSNIDITMTKNLVAYLNTINVSLLDHIIITDNDYLSFRDSGYSFLGSL